MSRDLKHEAIMADWDRIEYGIEPGELHPFTLGISARRVRKASPVRETRSYIVDGSTNYAEQYQKEELKAAMMVNCVLFLSVLFFNI